MARFKGQNTARRAMETFVELREALERMEALLNHQLDALGVTMNEIRILEALRGGPASHAELSKTLVCSVGNARRVVKILERHGLAGRQRDTAGRKSLARLTAAGAKKIAEVFPHHAKLVHAQMSAISTREQNTLRRICEKLSAGDAARLVSVLSRQENEDEGE